MCCIAAALPCCNSYQLPVSIGYRTPLGSARLDGVLDIFLGNGEFIFMCKVLRGKGSSWISLFQFSPPISGCCRGSRRGQELSVCEFFGETFPSDEAELCQIYLVLGFSENPGKVGEDLWGSPHTGSDHSALIFPGGLGDLLDALMLVDPFDRSWMGSSAGWQQCWGGVGGREKGLSRAKIVQGECSPCLRRE